MSKAWKAEWFWLAGLGVLLLLHFWFPWRGPGPAHDTYSTEAEGKKAFYLLLKEQLNHVQRVHDPVGHFAERLAQRQSEIFARRDVICLLGPEYYPNEAQWEALLGWVSQGGNLVVAAREDTPKMFIPQLQLSIEPADIAGDMPLTDLVNTENVLWLSRGRINAFRAGLEDRLVLLEGELQAVVQQHGRGRVLVLASDFIFTNQSLAWADNPVLAFRLMELLGVQSGNIYIDESLNQSATPKVVGLLFDPKFRPITIQLLIGILLFSWWRSRRFGPLRPERFSSRLNIVDHTDTVGTLWFKSNHGALALRAYLRQLVTELKLKTFKGREDRVLQPIAVRLGKDVSEIKSWIREAGQASKSNKPPSRKTVAEMISRLTMIRQAAQPEHHQSA